MLILISGGAKNGKSKFGEELCGRIATGPLCYIATMYHNPNDPEVTRRIQQHRCMRLNKGFTTLEQYMDIKDLQLKNYDTALLECLPNLLANEMFLNGISAKNCATKILNDIQIINSSLNNLVIITNEIFQDGYSYTEETAEYIQSLGSLNSQLAKLCTEIYEVVCGIPIKKSMGLCQNKI